MRVSATGNLPQQNLHPSRNANASSSSFYRTMKSNTEIMDESHAKRQIQLICRTPACWRGKSDERLMVDLLQRFPVLASQYYDWDYNLFWKHGNEWSSPLSFLLVAGATLEVIEVGISTTT